MAKVTPAEDWERLRGFIEWIRHPIEKGNPLLEDVTLVSRPRQTQ